MSSVNVNYHCYYFFQVYIIYLWPFYPIHLAGVSVSPWSCKWEKLLCQVERKRNLAKMIVRNAGEPDAVVMHLGRAALGRIPWLLTTDSKLTLLSLGNGHQEPDVPATSLVKLRSWPAPNCPYYPLVTLMGEGVVGGLVGRAEVTCLCAVAGVTDKASPGLCLGR